MDAPSPTRRVSHRRRSAGNGEPLEGREPYLSAAHQLIRQSGCTIRRWRAKTTGVAFTKASDFGIEVPRPNGPVSFATFAHEVGHQMLHRGPGKRLRYIEEIEAWQYALDTFDRFTLPGRQRALADADRCLDWAFMKAIKNARTKAVERCDQALVDAPAWWGDDERRSQLRQLARQVASKQDRYHPTAWPSPAHGVGVWKRVTAAGTIVVSSTEPPKAYTRYARHTVVAAAEPLPDA